MQMSLLWISDPLIRSNSHCILHGWLLNYISKAGMVNNELFQQITAFRGWRMVTSVISGGIGINNTMVTIHVVKFGCFEVILWKLLWMDAWIVGFVWRRKKDRHEVLMLQHCQWDSWCSKSWKDLLFFLWELRHWRDYMLRPWFDIA